MVRVPRRFVLVVLSTAVALIAAEAVVRWQWPQFNPNASAPVVATNQNKLRLGPKSATFRQKKYSGDYDVQVKTNRHGFRDRRDVDLARAGDLLVVGDSFSFGWGVEEADRFSNLFEAATGQRTFNIAIPGTAIDHYQATVEHAESLGAYGDRLVIGLCMENDLLNYQTATRQPGIPSVSFYRLIKKRLNEHSALYTMAKSVVKSQPGLHNLFIHLGLITDNLQSVEANEIDGAALQSSVDALKTLALGYDTWVVIIPSRALWTGDQRDTERQVHERALAMMKQAGLRVVDLRPAFEATSRPLDYHFRHDPHWNPRGHRLAADELAIAFSRDGGATD